MASTGVTSKSLEDVVKLFGDKLANKVCSFPLKPGDFVQLFLDSEGNASSRVVDPSTSPKSTLTQTYEVLSFVIKRGTLELHRSLSPAEILRRPLGDKYAESDKDLFYAMSALLQHGQFRTADEIVALLKDGLYVRKVIRKSDEPTREPVIIWSVSR